MPCSQIKNRSTSDHCSQSVAVGSKVREQKHEQKHANFSHKQLFLHLSLFASRSVFILYVYFAQELEKLVDWLLKGSLILFPPSRVLWVLPFLRR